MMRCEWLVGWVRVSWWWARSRGKNVYLCARSLSNAKVLVAADTHIDIADEWFDYCSPRKVLLLSGARCWLVVIDIHKRVGVVVGKK